MNKVLAAFAFLAILHVSSAFPLELKHIGSIDEKFAGSYEKTVLFRADLDNDGNPDLVLSMIDISGPTVAAIWYGQRDDKYDPADWKTLPISESLQFGVRLSIHPMDLDHDGLYDLVFSNAEGRIFFFKNLGDRLFAPQVELMGTDPVTGARLIFPCDVNNDGVQDLVVFGPNFLYGHILNPNITDTTVNVFTSTPSVAGVRCHRTVDGTNYIVANNEPFMLFNGTTQVASLAIDSFFDNFYLNVTTNEQVLVAQFTTPEDVFLIVIYRPDGTNSSRPEANVPTVDVAGFPQDSKSFFPYNDDGDFLILNFGGLYSVSVVKSDLTQGKILVADVSGAAPVLSITNRSPNEPEVFFFAQTRKDRSRFDIFMYGPMLRPSIEPAWKAFSASGPLTIQGKNIAQAQSLRVMWRVKDGACDISALTGATNGCPGMIRSGDNITCTIPTVTGQDCIVQARVVATYSVTQRDRMSSWENQLVLGNGDFRPLTVNSIKPVPARNGTRVFFRMRSVPSTFAQLPYTLQLVNASCSGFIEHTCASTYNVEAEGFSCGINHALLWGQVTDLCLINATFSTGGQVVATATVARLTRVIPITLTPDLSLPFNALSLSTTFVSISTTEEFLPLFPTNSDPVLSWTVKVEEHPRAVARAASSDYTFGVPDNGALNVGFAFISAFLPKFQLISKDGLYESDVVALPDFNAPLSIVHARIIPEAVEVVESLNIEVLFTQDWRQALFASAMMNISFSDMNRPTLSAFFAPFQCANVTAQLKTNPLVFGYIPVYCRLPYFAGNFRMVISAVANQTSYTAETAGYNPGLFLHPQELPALRAINDAQSNTYPTLDFSFAEGPKSRPTFDFELGTKCAYESGGSPVQFRFAVNQSCFTWSFDSMARIEVISVRQECMPEALNRTNLDGCTLYYRAATQPPSPWMPYLAVAAYPAPEANPRDFIFNKGQKAFSFTITGQYLGYAGEEAATDVTLVLPGRQLDFGRDERSSIVLSADGRSIQCNVFDFPIDTPSDSVQVLVKRYSQNANSVVIGNFYVRPLFNSVTPTVITSTEQTESSSILISVFGEFIRTSGSVPDAPNGLLMSYRLGGPNCLNSTAPVSYTETITATTQPDSTVLYRFPNFPGTLFIRDNVDGCILYFNYTERVGASVEVPFSVVSAGTLSVNDNSPSTLIETNGTVSIAGNFLPRLGEPLFLAFTSETSAQCLQLAQQGNASISEDFPSTSNGLTLKLRQFAAEIDGCNLVLQLQRAGETVSFLGTFVTPPQISTVFFGENAIAASELQSFTLYGSYLPNESENPAVSLTFEDGPSVCRNKTALTATITSLSRTEINFTMPYDVSRDSCRVNAVVSRLITVSHRVYLGTLYSAPVLTEQALPVRLNTTFVTLTLTGTNLPRSHGENPRVVFSTNCSIDLAASGVNSSILSYFNADGTSLLTSMSFPFGVMASLDNCFAFVTVSRGNGVVSSPVTLLGKFVLPPQLSSLTTGLYLSGQSFSVVFNGMQMPVTGDDFFGVLVSSCNYDATATSSSLIVSGTNLTATFAGVPANQDGCTLSAGVSRSGMVATTLLGTVISRPVITAGSVQLTAERTATLLINGDYFPRSGESFSIALNTTCSAFPTIDCGAPSIAIPGTRVSCNIVAPLALGCDVSAVVTREGYASASATVGRIVSPVFAPTSKSLTLVVKLEGTNPPPQSLVQQICAVIGAAFAPPLVPGINITCAVQTKRSVVETYSVLAQVLGENAINSAESQITTPQFLTSLTSTVSNSISGSGFIAQPIIVDAPAPVAAPVATPVPTPSGQPTPVPAPGGGGAVTDGSSGLGGGAIAGIVIAIVFAIAIIAVVVILLLRRKPTSGSSSTAATSGNSAPMKPTSGSAASPNVAKDCKAV